LPAAVDASSTPKRNMEREFEDRLRALVRDNESGSRALAGRAAALFSDVARRSDISPAELRRFLKKAARDLESAHSGLQAVIGLCNDTILVVDSTPQDERLREQLVDMLSRWDEIYSRRVRLLIFCNAYQVLQNARRIVSHSYSSTVLGVLVSLEDRSPGLEVIQSISEPVREGLRMARLLVEGGVGVRLVADAGLAAEVEQADAVVVGADGVSAEGVLNKLGTLGLALAARFFNVPIYAVFDTAKLLPPDKIFEIEEKDPGELAEPSDERIKVRNVYFDRTPLELFTALITEERVYSPEEMRALLTK
jgi:translation initiation factor eIF-2B subunit delta